MCETCGCGEIPERNNRNNRYDRYDHHDHHGYHDHDHEHLPDGRVIRIQKDILGENNLVAERNRGFLEAKRAICFNIVGSPGSGKTTLLERTCRDLGKEQTFYVIEGDQQSSLDAERIKTTGVKAIQINTEYGCHLDAAMVNKALKELEVKEKGIIFIENVGNLVCPAMFDLGETKRIVIYSVTEGNDKPLKYPYMFRSAHLAVITKTDLIPYVDFDLDRARVDIRKTHPGIEVIELSVKSGEGLENWYDWLKEEGRGKRTED
ncbi:MAG: hydrogenase nickel incorporation protein HypB [Bacteroidales bacterium]|nr:hydrogenase nickel incorporation protein HypB [Deltaproteobacteria bacterium]MBL7137474.1 hydrogenase nickel incorporation protein HypB [Bacteroidales bacterium]